LPSEIARGGNLATRTGAAMHAIDHSPRFADLSERSTRALLARNHVGRLAFAFKDRVDIQPIHYVYDDEWLIGRTGIGSKLVKLAHNPWCAFEVDEVHGLFHWDSVVVHGSFSMLDPKVGSTDLYQRAVELLQRFIPGTMSSTDPVPERAIPFAIHIDELRGRSARPADD
jgi:nitroimidazol reductase NimA-like FMN-containing flavoprotein (pyridoxamine 5'-phosphate oxidase superfamily)